MTRIVAIVWIVFALAACAIPRAGSLASQNGPEGTPPPLLVGTFEDDYDIEYAISERLWHQYPDTRYHIVQWHATEQYLIAQNDAANPGDGGLWTRIDWIVLPEMEPYTWAFCLSAYAAPSQAEAEQADVAERDRPRTGCNGYPFSRMRRTGAGGP